MPKTALIVDDSIVAIDTITGQLQRLGFRVDARTTVEAATQLLSRGPVDVVIFNLGLASSETVPELAALTAACDCTMIVVPQADAQATVGNAMAAGAHGMLVPTRATLIDYETALVFAEERWAAQRQPHDHPDSSESLIHGLLADLMKRAPLAVWTVTPRSDAPTTVVPRLGRGDLGPDVAVGWSSHLSAQHFNETEPVILSDGLAQERSLPALEFAVTISIMDATGHPFGTLCGLHTAAISNVNALLTEAQHTAGFVAGALELDERLSAAEARCDHLEAKAGLDRVTGLLGMAAFEAGLDLEDKRARRHEKDATVVYVSVPSLATPTSVHDHAAAARSEALAEEVRTAVVDSVRGSDPVYRLSDSLFAVIAADCDKNASHLVAGRVSRCLDRAKINHAASHRSSASGTLRTAARDARLELEAPADAGSLSARLVRPV